MIIYMLFGMAVKMPVENPIPTLSVDKPWKKGPLGDKTLADKPGLSRRGAKFLVTKLRTEGSH
jgi:hypothetical protein